MAREWFENNELECPCCGMYNFSDSTLKKLNVARTLSGVPYKINSGCRCEKHNKEVGGSPTSSHIASETKVSTAVDISVSDSSNRFKILHGLIAAGFTRIGIAKTFIHADDDKSKSPEVCWLY